MIGEPNPAETGNKEPTDPEATSSGRRERSTIEFPYGDLDSAMGLPQKVYERGGDSCQLAELAAALGHSPSGGAFRSRLSAARTFGLLSHERGQVHLTPLGRRIADPEQERDAKAEAFLSVALYRKIYDKYLGYQLPPTTGLERQMVEFGVAPKQADKARQAFLRSAQQAGFFETGSDRLVKPASTGPSTRPISQTSKQAADETRPEEKTDLDPVIAGLIDKLPKPGSIWPIEQRKLWLLILENSFQLVYKESPSIEKYTNDIVEENDPGSV